MPYEARQGIGIVKRLTSTKWEWDISEFWTLIPNSVLGSDLFKIEDKLVLLKVSVVYGYIFVRLLNYSTGSIERKFSVGLRTRDRAVRMLSSDSKSIPKNGDICFCVTTDEVLRLLPPSFDDLVFTLRAEPLTSTAINAEPGTSQVTDECVAGGTKKESTEETSESEKLILPKPKSMANLVNSLKQLLESEKNTDAVLKVKGKDFKAHRYILTARSPVLLSTFEHDMEEKRTGVVIIDDCDPESFYDFLLFLYTGRTAKLSSSDHAIELYKTAHKYDVPDLREECVEYLRDNLTVENVCDVMNLALQYEEDWLNKVAKDFFLNNSSTVAETPQFGKFMVSNTKTAQKLIAHIRR